MKCSLLVLSSYLDGELEARREGELEAHLVGCQRCRAGIGYLREEVERVGALGRVHVADHSVHALLTQLGLIDAGEALPERALPVALAEPPSQAPAWMGGDDATTLPWVDHANGLEPSVDMTGTAARGGEATPAEPERPWFRWLPAEATVDGVDAADAPIAPADEVAPPPTEYEPPPPRPAFTWSPPPATPQAGGTEAAPGEEGVPAVPFTAETGLPASSLMPPPTISHGPPPLDLTADHAPSVLPSGGAFPPGGPERIEPSDSLTHDLAPGGEPEMTASPPWSPHETATGPLYPMTDDDVLGTAMPVERFGPPPQAARPGLLERLRDRFAVRRALSRSSSAYEDQVQIVSGLGAPLRPGRARLEVERRRQETLHMDPGAIPGEAVAGGHGTADIEFESDADADLGLGPLPPPFPQAVPMPRPPARQPGPGQMALPGTSVSDPFNPSSVDPRAPIHRVPMPPPRHSIGSVLGEATPPHEPLPPAAPPPPPVPDPLAEALSGFDRDRDLGTAYEPRPWRPREVAEDHLAAAPPRRFGAPPAETVERHRHSPSQLRDGRRMLAIFGAATLLMFIVGIVSGRTTSPRPTGATSSGATAAAPPARSAQSSHSASSSSTASGQNRVLPSAQPSQSAAGSTPQLTSVKELGDSGTGYQVKDFRYGIHPGDFRIVLDLDASGTASGTPKATIGLVDPTTLYVVLTGVVPAGSTGQLPSTNPVTGITLLPQSPFPGAVTYQIKLAHPVQFSAGYMSGPLRLVLDIAS